MKKQRKHYTAEEKVAILRRHLLEGVAVSSLCDELGVRRLSLKETLPRVYLKEAQLHFWPNIEAPGKCAEHFRDPQSSTAASGKNGCFWKIAVRTMLRIF